MELIPSGDSERYEMPETVFLLITGCGDWWVDQSDFEWNSISLSTIIQPCSFSSSTACYFVRSNQQFFSGRCQNIFFWKRRLSHLRKTGPYTPMIANVLWRPCDIWITAIGSVGRDMEFL